jgi:hypothetical protein
MKITEKVRHKMCGGVGFAVWYITELAAGANNLSAPTLGFSEIHCAAYEGNTLVTSAAATSFATATTYKGDTVTITADTANDAGTLKVWGY